jgi:hypothetical protein
MSHLVVDPMWPLFGLMLGGYWLALPWFAFNGFAAGSASLRKELAIAVGGLVAGAASLAAISALFDAGVIRGTAVEYALLVLTLVKLATGYWLYLTQNRGVSLFEYFGGELKNGLWVVIIAAVFLDNIVRGAIGWSFLRILLG